MCPTTTNSLGWFCRHPRRRTAIHEAGHAVIAISEGCEFEDIRLAKTENSNGMVRDLACHSKDDEIVRILLGGIMAARLSRHRWGRDFFDTAHDDVGEVARFIIEHGIDCNTSLHWNIPHTARKLERHWSAVIDIASALLRNRIITRDEALLIFDEAEKNPRDLRPSGRLCKRGWQPLYDEVERRIKYPNGIADVISELMSKKINDDSSTIVGKKPK